MDLKLKVNVKPNIFSDFNVLAPHRKVIVELYDNSVLTIETKRKRKNNYFLTTQTPCLELFVKSVFLDKHLT